MKSLYPTRKEAHRLPRMMRFAMLAHPTRAFPTDDTETRCALLKEAWQVAPSDKHKMAVLDEDKKQGGRCKLQDLSKPMQ